MRGSGDSPSVTFGFRLRLRPWQALVVLPLLLAMPFAAQALLEHRLGAQVDEAVRQWIVTNLQAPRIEHMQEALHAPNVPRAELERLGLELADAPRVEIHDLRVHGWGSKVVLRVAYQASDAEAAAFPDPAGGVRYFRAAWLPFSGWTVLRESNAFAYYLELI